MNLSTAPAEDILLISNETLLKSKARNRRRVTACLGGLIATGVAIAIMGIAFNRIVRESWRETCSAQLKRIGLAMQNYQADHDHFPAPAIVGHHGEPLLSWRVALLPQLGYRSLYERFHLDEPWDSLHNLALLSEMPAEFGCPGGPARNKGQTGYLVVVGPTIDAASVNTPFDSTRGVDIREITDGTSNTILVLETDRSVPWTKPDDLRWDRNQPPLRLASPHRDGTNVLLADGTTRFLKITMDPRILLSILTMNGGEVTTA